MASGAAEPVANARATRAGQAQRRAEADREEADAAAEEALRTSEQLTQDLAGVREKLAPPGKNSLPGTSSKLKRRRPPNDKKCKPKLPVYGPR